METTTTETKPSRFLTEAARCAADIRRVLKAAFPAIKFRVISENFSMGDAVRIKWTDGPASDAVEALVGRFEGGTFDGMTDSYTYAKADATTPNRAKFVTCYRELSDAVLAEVKADMTAFTADTSERYIDETVYQLLRTSDLSGGYASLHHSERGWEIIEARPIVRAREAA